MMKKKHSKITTQKQLAEIANMSRSYICELVNRKKIPLYKTAKKLAGITGTKPILWLEGTRDELRAIFGK